MKFTWLLLRQLLVGVILLILIGVIVFLTCVPHAMSD